MKRVAYLTGRKWRGQIVPAGELPSLEAGDFPLLSSAAEARDISFCVEYWDNEEIVARGYEAAIIRSCWDYPDRAEEFVTRLNALEGDGLRVFNSSAVVQWNSRKTYLQELEALGAPTIPTVWMDRVEPHAVARAFSEFEAAELVLKPQIGAGSRETVRLRRNDWSAGDLILGPRGPAMAQPFLVNIEHDGEASLFFFGGTFSHAVLKRPAPGHWFANALDASFAAWIPDDRARRIAEDVIAMAGRDLLYVRVDLVRGGDNTWRVIELEAIEPYLFLKFAPEGAARFAEALAFALG